MPIIQQTSKRSNDAAGFALVIALTLMAFVLLLILSLTTFVRVETTSAEAALEREEARQNALFGAKVALGELQRYAGPDQRTTGQGHLLSRAAGSAVLLDPSTEPRAMWTGVMRSDGAVGASPPSFDFGQPVRWLVSGVNPVTNALRTDLDRIQFYGAGSYAVTSVSAGGNTVEQPGPAIEAGLVEIESDAPGSGGFAYFVEDEGIKAKLRVEAPDSASLSEGAVVPGAFTDFGRLDGWDEFEDGALAANLPRTLADLSFFELAADFAGKRRFDYTFHSYGVLSNARLGGLREDLTTAFEDPDAFDAVFQEGDRLVVDDDKLDQAGELETNDYISWKIFRDYYGLHDRNEVQNDGRMTAASMSIPRNAGSKRLATQFFDHGALREGPHGFPRYDEADQTYYVYVDDNDDMSQEERTYNPLKPVLAYMYYRAWVEIREVPPTDDPTFEGSAFMQPFYAFYNPYNVTLSTAEIDVNVHQNIGFRVTDANGKEVRTSPSSDTFQNGWRGIFLPGPGKGDEGNTRFWSAEDEHEIGPGEVVLFMIPGGTVVELTSVADFEFELTDDFSNIQASGYEQPFPFLNGPFVPPFTVEFQTLHKEQRDDRPYDFFSRGSRAGGASREPNIQPYQFFIPSFGYDSVQTWNNSKEYPGKRVVVENVEPDATDNYDNAANFGMWLRTTKEFDQGIRPLIDANIRAAYVNPRWDASPTGQAGGLGLRTPATYTGLPRDATASESGVTIPGLNHNIWGIYEGTIGSPTGGNAFPQLANTDGQMRGWWGNSHETSGQHAIPVFDIPREPPVSLGQFQHAEAGHYSYEPSYVAGNSYANPRIPLDDWRNQGAEDTFLDGRGVADPFTISGDFNLYDASYLVNEVLWDDFTFTTLPINDSGPASYTDLIEGKKDLPNPRYQPYTPDGFAFDASKLEEAGEDGIRRNAGFVLSDGAFNVNSTSVNAWEAFLSSTSGLPVARIDGDGQMDGSWTTGEVRFPRLTSHRGDGGDFWEGFAELSADQVRELAVAMVREVRERGPFRNLGEFVNRWNPDVDKHFGLSGLAISSDDDRRKSGALQAALDASVNQDGFVTSNGDAVDFLEDAMPDDANQATGFPGHILQGDVLQALGPYLSTRSDTFKIRAYGEASSIQGDKDAGAWCEMVVQRVPDPMMPEGGAAAVPDNKKNAELIEPSSPLGRQFRIVSFRWIEADAL